MVKSIVSINKSMLSNNRSGQIASSPLHPADGAAYKRLAKNRAGQVVSACEKYSRSKFECGNFFFKTACETFFASKRLLTQK